MPLSGQCDVTPLKMEKHKPNCISKIFCNLSMTKGSCINNRCYFWIRSLLGCLRGHNAGLPHTHNIQVVGRQQAKTYSKILGQTTEGKDRMIKNEVALKSQSGRRGNIKGLI